MRPTRVPFQRGATRVPSAMASGDPASTACSSGVVAPSRRMKAKAKGAVERVLLGRLRAPTSTTRPCRPGPTSTKS